MKRQPRPKPGQLVLWYGKLPDQSPDFCWNWHLPAMKGDGGSIIEGFKDIGLELARRGYDLSTLKLTIEKPAVAVTDGIREGKS